MINKKTAHDNGIKIIDSKNLLSDKDNDLIEKLKKLLPQVINVDNQIDTKALNDIVDISATTANNQGYELTFAGKGLAKAAASAPTIKELKTISTQSKDYDNTENVVIRGDNLDVLKILSANYFNQIKMIYIDPPYNTKSENFIYKDNFKKSDNDLIENFAMDEDQIDFLQNVYGTRSHSGWLSFMYPRLKLARDLLKDDGVIFVSIDDNEQANLKIMCDEIFGEDNFVTSFIWEKKKKPAFLHKNVGKLAEYILCYTKNNNNSFAFSVEETEAGKRTPINNAGNTKAILTIPKGSVNFDLKD
ncbi:MAG: site-specific DNA-methyltransferase, partial [Gammaproteobacteria bacterium]